MRTTLTSGMLALLLLAGWTSRVIGAEPSPQLAPPCPQMNDDCFASLEKEHLSRGGIGAQIVPVRQAGEFYTVGAVVPNGAADRGGLKAGDRILAVNGRKLLNSTQAELEAAAEHYHETHLNLRQGETITYTVLRDGSEKSIAIVAGPRTLGGARFYLRAHLQIRYGPEWGKAYGEYIKRNPAASP